MLCNASSITRRNKSSVVFDYFFFTTWDRNRKYFSHWKWFVITWPKQMLMTLVLTCPVVLDLVHYFYWHKIEIQLTQPAAKRRLRGIFSSYANTLSLRVIHSVRATNFVSVCACICHKSNKLTFSPIYCKHTNTTGTHNSDELRRRASVSQIYLLGFGAPILPLHEICSISVIAFVYRL